MDKRYPDYDRAATMAYRCITALGVNRMPIDPLFMLKKCRNVALKPYSALREEAHMSAWEFDRHVSVGQDAFVARRSRQGKVHYLVCYEDEGNPARRRFTLAHELGHIVLGHTDQGAYEEEEANHFAMHLLCPRPVLRQLEQQSAPLCAERIATVCFISVSCAMALERAKPCSVSPDLLRQVNDLLAPAVQAALEKQSFQYPYRHAVHYRPFFRSR